MKDKKLCKEISDKLRELANLLDTGGASIESGALALRCGDDEYREVCVISDDPEIRVRIEYHLINK